MTRVEDLLKLDKNELKKLYEETVINESIKAIKRTNKLTHKLYLFNILIFTTVVIQFIVLTVFVMKS